MIKTELETTLDKLEHEVLDELENPFKPYSLVFPYEVRCTIDDDGKNTEIIIRTRSEEILFGRNEKDILLQKELYNEYGKQTYAKHILNWVSKRLPNINPREVELEFKGSPTPLLMNQEETKEFIKGCLDDE